MDFKHKILAIGVLIFHPIPKELIFGFGNVFEWGSAPSQWSPIRDKEI